MFGSTFRLCVLAFFFSIGLLTVAVTVPPDVRSRMIQLNESVLGAGANIDPRFTVSAEYGRPPLPGISCLMNAINAMQDLALEDFEEPLVPGPYILDSFPEVMITAQATTLGGAIQTRFIIWALWTGMTAMVERKVFQTAVFTLKFGVNTVGYLTIARPEASYITNQGNGTESPGKNVTDSSYVPEMAAAAKQLKDDTPLSVSFRPIGSALNGHDVLLAVLYGLVYAAHFPASQQVEPFELMLPAPYFMNIQVTAAPTMALEPIFEYKWVIKSLAQIPGYMLERKRFSGVSWRMRFDRAFLGDGQIFRKPPESRAVS